MKLFPYESDGEAGPSPDTAQLAIETGVLLVRTAKRAIRAGASDALSLPRLRALVFLADNPGACLTDLAEHLWVGVPTASKLADGLVEAGLLSRDTDAADRRRLSLGATDAGRRFIDTTSRPAQERLQKVLGSLDAPDRERVHTGLELLRDALRRPIPEASRG